MIATMIIIIAVPCVIILLVFVVQIRHVGGVSCTTTGVSVSLTTCTRIGKYSQSYRCLQSYREVAWQFTINNVTRNFTHLIPESSCAWDGYETSSCNYNSVSLLALAESFMGNITKCYVDLTTGSYFTSPLLQDDNSDTPARVKTFWTIMATSFLAVGVFMYSMWCIIHVCLNRYVKVLMDTRASRHQIHTSSLTTFLLGLAQARHHHRHDHDHVPVAATVAALNDDDDDSKITTLTHLVNNELYDPHVISIISSFAYRNISDAHISQSDEHKHGHDGGDEKKANRNHDAAVAPTPAPAPPAVAAAVEVTTAPTVRATRRHHHGHSHGNGRGERNANRHHVPTITIVPASSSPAAVPRASSTQPTPTSVPAATVATPVLPPINIIIHP
jgi:hypothetical protein